MKHLPFILLTAGCLLALPMSVEGQLADDESSTNYLAMHCASSSGLTASAYQEYGRKLAKTLGLLAPAQQERVFGYVPQPGTTAPIETTPIETTPTETRPIPKWVNSTLNYLRAIGQDGIAAAVESDFWGAVDSGLIDENGNLPTDSNGNELDADGNIIDPSAGPKKK